MALWIILSLLALQDHAAVAVCGGNYAGSLSGNLSTPNYPQNYPDSSNCIWFINCPYRHVVSVNLRRINIEADKTCAFDYLIFFDGSSQRANELSAEGSVGKLKQNKACGALFDMRWKSTGPSITAKFKSDDSTSEKGFSGTWSCIAAPVITTTVKTGPLPSSAKVSTTRAFTRASSISNSFTHVKKTTSRNAHTGGSPKSTPPSHYISTARPAVTTEGFTVTRNDKTTTARANGKSSIVSAIPTTASTASRLFCGEEVFRKIVWKKKPTGGIWKEPCPAASSGFASRECFVTKNGQAKWSHFIDTSGCVSNSLEQIQKNVNNPNIPSISSINELLVKSKDPLVAGDVISITQQLRDLTVKAIKVDLKNPKKGELTVLNRGFVEVGNNLLDSSAWNELTAKRRMKTVGDLLRNLEDLALAVIKAQSKSQLESIDYIDSITPNIVSSSKAIAVNGSGSVSLLSNDLKGKATLENSDWKLLGQVNIPRKTIKDIAGGNSKCFSVCIVARNAGKLLSGEQAVRGTNAVESRSVFVNTFVTSLAISPKPTRPFPEPVVISGKSLVKLDPKKAESKCSFWNTNSSSPTWSQAGVETISVKADETVCHTSHFTNFAVLMRTNSTKLSARHGLILMIITQIGIGISLLCLILALSIFVNCKSLQSVRNTIHKNLCVSLALAYVVFVVGISRTENKIVCTVFATFLYYFLLVAFLWMLMEGVQLYILLVQIFPRGDGFKKHYYAICWGFPAVLSVVLCGSHPHGFGNDSFCWLSTKDHFIWAFVVPVLVIILVNSVFLVMTFRTILRNSSIIAREQEMRRTMDKISYWAKGSVGLVPLLGITWLFGVLYINDDAVVMAYLFTFCNAFQGMYIFIFYCIMNEKVRDDFRRRFCAISRSSSHSFSAASKKSMRGSARISLTAINFPWNQRRGTQTVKDVIVVHDPTVVRNGTGSTGTTANIDGTFSKRYQDIVRDDAAIPESTAALSSIDRNGKEIYRASIHSTNSKDSSSDLMSPEVTRLGGMLDDSDGEMSHDSLVKPRLDGEDEELEQLPACKETEMQEFEHTPCQDEADQFEERIMRAIEMNIRRTLSEEDVAIDMYDDQTVYV